MNDPDDIYMRLAIEQARHAADHDDVPIGAVIVDAAGEVIATGENRRELDGDPTAHAEIVAIRRAAERIGHWRVEDVTLYVTLEPCAMCAGAIVNARIPRVVFGASDPKAGAVESHFHVGIDSTLNHRFSYRAGVLRQDCVALLQRFFAKLRAAGEK